MIQSLFRQQETLEVARDSLYESDFTQNNLMSSNISDSTEMNQNNSMCTEYLFEYPQQHNDYYKQEKEETNYITYQNVFINPTNTIYQNSPFQNEQIQDIQRSVSDNLPESENTLNNTSSEEKTDEDSDNFYILYQQWAELQQADKTLKSNNIIKNLIKQYYNYLMKPSNSSLVSEFIIQKPISYSKKLIKKYFKGINYNNSSLIKLLKHQKYGKGLEYYLTFDAIDELQKSKVQNMAEHISTIQFLNKCCVNHKLLDHINFYKKKGKSSQD